MPHDLSLLVERRPQATSLHPPQSCAATSYLVSAIFETSHLHTDTFI